MLAILAEWDQGGLVLMMLDLLTHLLLEVLVEVDPDQEAQTTKDQDVVMVVLVMYSHNLLQQLLLYFLPMVHLQVVVAVVLTVAETFLRLTEVMVVIIQCLYLQNLLLDMVQEMEVQADLIIMVLLLQQLGQAAAQEVQIIHKI